MSATFYGEWSKLLGTMQAAAGRIDETLNPHLVSFGEAVKQSLQAAMRRNSFTLSPATLRRKQGRGGAWYDWGELHDHGIGEIQVEKRGLGYSAVNVAFSSDAHSSGPSYAAIAQWLEHGTRRQPPRPIIGPKLAAITASVDPDFLKFKEDVENYLAELFN